MPEGVAQVPGAAGGQTTEDFQRRRRQGVSAEVLGQKGPQYLPHSQSRRRQGRRAHGVGGGGVETEAGFAGAATAT